MKFTLEPCPHCGRLPTRNEIVAELQRIQDVFLDLHDKLENVETSSIMSKTSCEKLRRSLLKKVRTVGKEYVKLKLKYSKRFLHS